MWHVNKFHILSMVDISNTKHIQQYVYTVCYNFFISFAPLFFLGLKNFFNCMPHSWWLCSLYKFFFNNLHVHNNNPRTRFDIKTLLIGKANKVKWVDFRFLCRRALHSYAMEEFNFGNNAVSRTTTFIQMNSNQCLLRIENGWFLKSYTLSDIIFWLKKKEKRINMIDLE